MSTNANPTPANGVSLTTLAEQLHAIPPVTKPKAASAPKTPKVSAPRAKAATEDAGYTEAVKFTWMLIKALCKAEGGKRKGVHCRYSGFNSAMAAHFKLDSAETRQLTDRMVASGHLETHFCKGGVMFYIPGEMPGRTQVSGTSLLRKLGLE